MPSFGIFLNSSLFVCFGLSHILSYHIISYHIISYYIILYHIISYHIISYHIILYHIMPYHIISYSIPLFLTLILSSNIISCDAFFIPMYPPILLTWNMPWWNVKFDVFIFVWNVSWLRIYYFHLNTSHSISLYTYSISFFSSSLSLQF